MSQQPTPPLTAEQILHAFSTAEKHHPPLQALREADHHRAELIPSLQASIDLHLALSAARRLQAEGDWRLPSFAFTLLAYWRVPGTYERLLAAFSLKDGYDVSWLMGDACDNWPDILLTTFDGDAARLQRLAFDSRVKLEVRICILAALAAATHHGLADRTLMSDWYEAVLDGKHEPVAFDAGFWDELVIGVAWLKLHHLKPKVLKVQRWIAAQTSHTVTPEELNDCYQKPWPEDGHDARSVAQLVNDPVQHVLGWAYFSPPRKPYDDPLEEYKTQELFRRLEAGMPTHARGARVGWFILPERHVPCHCGSGQPYGVCCGQK